MPSFLFSLDPVAPFRLDLTAWALRRRPSNRIDRLDRGVYRRIIAVGHVPVEVTVSQPAGGERPRVEVHVKGIGRTKRVELSVATAIRKMFGMTIDLSRFYQIAEQDSRLGPLATGFLGLKPPRFPSVFEATVNAIACQQLSLDVGILLLNRLSEACAPSVLSDTGDRLHAFPRPRDLLELRLTDLRAMGFSTRKAEFLLDLAEATEAGGLDLEGFAALGRQEAMERLMRIRGIGRWTAEYVLLRGTGDLSAFPGDDVGGRNKLRHLLQLGEPLSYEAVRKITSRWDPYPGFVYFHLLLDDLARKGHVIRETRKLCKNFVEGFRHL